MAHTSWFYLVYGAGLFYLAIHKDKISNVVLFSLAWFLYAAAMLLVALFTVIRAATFRSSFKMPLVEIWADGVSWTFVGLSLLALLAALVVNRK